MITNYADLLTEARTQAEPQRLLFVFCRAELPDDASSQEKADFEKGEGGALTPVVCVDKAMSEVESFDIIVEESRQTGQNWDVVFVAAMSGRGGVEPTSEDTRQPMTMMVEAIRLGHIGNYLPLNPRGEAVQLH